MNLPHVIRRSLPLATLTVLLVCASCVTPVSTGQAKMGGLELPAIFSDNMVLQRNMRVPVWGTDTPGSVVNVTLTDRNPYGGARRARETTLAKADGSWRVDLPVGEAGGPYILEVAGSRTLTFDNVMSGEVWLCSGQSNMQFSVNGAINAEAEMAAADYPDIRLVTVPRRPEAHPQKDADIDGWKVCRPDTVPSFSAVGYFFGRDLHEALEGVPIGLINSSYGGTPVEAWTSAGSLQTVPEMADALNQLDAAFSTPEKAQAQYEQAYAKFMDNAYAKDAGFTPSREAQWAAPDLDLGEWQAMTLPVLWESTGYKDFDGWMWFRRDVDLPAGWAGKDLTLSLGPINDMDIAWFNGTEVGRFEIPDSVETPRVYTVPGELVQAGQNTITVRVYDMGGNGGIWGQPEEMSLQPAAAGGDAPISLAGVWRNRVGVALQDVGTPPQLTLGRNQNLPSALYNGMIHPLVPYGMRGAIWYQGESNAGRAYQYRTLFPLLIQDWRNIWGQGDLPFYFVQLANFFEREAEPSEHSWAELREAQALALTLPNTGMATAIDIGEAADIHPKNKQELGRRLALGALANVYGQDVVHSGPMLHSSRVEDNRIRLVFDHVDSGLEVHGEELAGFAIAGEDRNFVWANAEIQGNDVVVWNDAIANPVAVRYGWAANPVITLYNKAGLPAPPFRTDDWPGTTWPQQ